MKHPITGEEWEFVDGAMPQAYSDDDYYAICNGYCEPERLLARADQLMSVNEAVMVLESFFHAARELELIEEM